MTEAALTRQTDEPKIAEFEPGPPSSYPPSVQPGIPNLGRQPDGWSRIRAGDLLKPVYRPAKLEDDQQYQLVTAKRNRGGIVPREILSGCDIRTKTQFFIEVDDFLISRRQISHGACGLVPKHLAGAVVSNEYVALKPKPSLDLRFLRHLSHSVYFQQTCFHSSIGVHVEKLVFKLEDWLDWEFDIPSLAEQRRIADVLDAWDRAIATTGALIAEKQRFLNKIVHRLSQNRWAPIALGDLGSWVGGGTPSKSNPAFWRGDIPWVSPKDMSGWRITRTEDRISREAVRKSSTRLIPSGSVLVVTRSGILRNTVPCAVTEMESAINQDIKALLVDGPWSASLIALVLRWSSEQIRQSCVKTGTTVESIDLEALKAFPVSLPDGADAIAKAEAVVVGLARELELLKSELEQLQTLKRGLMQKLLTGDWRVGSPDGDAKAPHSSVGAVS